MIAAEREAERLIRLAAAIITLPMAERAVYLLSAVDGLDYPQIGFRLGLTVDDVERHMAGAMRALHRELYDGDGLEKTLK